MTSEAVQDAVFAARMRRGRTYASRRVLWLLLAAVLAPPEVAVAQNGSTIFVSSTCSLADAIQAANFDSSTTECSPGTGDDTIVLPAGAVLRFTAVQADRYSPFGPAALPIVFSTVTIEGNGARLEAAAPDGVTFRAFSVGQASVPGPDGVTRTGTGNLTIRNLHIAGFAAKGGDGACGGGGGMGAGGAVYAGPGSVLTIESSTLEFNGAIGGNSNSGPAACPVGLSAHGPGGGGGGMGGNGGAPDITDAVGRSGAGGGGGGARGNGGDARLDRGGAGGGTLGSGDYFPGQRCGGSGADNGDNGSDAPCLGGGGGGGGEPNFYAGVLTGGTGGSGSYGGGGGGGGASDTTSLGDTFNHYGRDGGTGSFGGGGGACGGVAVVFSNSGGSSTFGGGGGSCAEGPGTSFFFGGRATDVYGGGGAGLGGAVFGHLATITIANSTFTRNYAVRGVSDGHFGRDRAGAVFAFQGTLTILNSTIAGNENTGSHGGVFYLNARFHSPALDFFCSFDPDNDVCFPPPGAFTLRNSIVAHNGVNFDGTSECTVEGIRITVAGSGNLVTQNDPDAACPGVVSTDDPALQPLRLNIPGPTPTMAILPTSAAVDAADPVTALPTDQRGVARPYFNGSDIGAYEARDPDFVLEVEPPARIALGETVSVPVTLRSVDSLMEGVSLTVRALAPSGLEVSVSPAAVTPTPDQPGMATLTVYAGSSAVAGEHFWELSATTEAGRGRRVGMTIVVAVSTEGMAKTIEEFRLKGAIANIGVATALTSKLFVAQTLVDGGDRQAGLNTLAAFGLNVRALSGKQITTDAATTLTRNLAVLMEEVAPLLTPTPLVGAVTDAAGSPVEGATVSILAGKSIVATATTDATGLYYVARTDTWQQGTSYSAKVTLPKGDKRSTPAELTFVWSRAQVVLPDFVVSK